MENLFGEFLKNYRKQHGLSLSELHRITGVSQPYLSQLESGKKPSVKIINKIAEGLANKAEDYSKYEKIYNQLLRASGYLDIPRVEVNNEARNYMHKEIEDILCSIASDNIFFDFLHDEIKKLELKYSDILETDQEITPEWLKKQVLIAEYDSEWIYELIGDLKKILKKYNLDLELQTYLLKEGITFKGKLIRAEDKKLINAYLEALFSNR